MVKIYEIPFPEKPSDAFEIRINGKKADAYRARVSRIPFNCVWPGHQRPMSQTELSAFIYFDTDETVDITVTPNRDFKEAVIRPLSKGIALNRENNTLSFKVNPGDMLSLELDGFHNNLQIFSNKILQIPDKSDPSVIYYGPGVHDAGRIILKDNQTLVIDAGSVVYGSVVINEARNVRICGHGILCNSVETRSFRFPSSCLDRDICALPEQLQSTQVMPEEIGALMSREFSEPKPLGCLNVIKSNYVKAEGIIFRDSSVWTATVTDCGHVEFDNVKTIGMWRYNADGIDFCNSHHGVVRNCFLRNFDDVIVVKGVIDAESEYTEELLFENNVLWCDWGRSFEIGAETCAKEIRNIIYRDSDILHGTYMHMDIQNGDSGYVHDVLYEDIRIEYTKYETEPILQESDEMEYMPASQTHMPYLFLAEITHGFWNKQPDPGRTSDVTLRNVAAVLDEGLPKPPISLVGKDSEHMVERVTFENVTVDGIPISAEDIQTNEYVSDVKVL